MEDASEGSLGDALEVCSHAFRVGSNDAAGRLLYGKGAELKRKWFTDRLRGQGPCVKVAYLDERPVALIQFCPEEAIPYVGDPREGVVSVLCAYSPIPGVQRRGVATALLRALVDECRTGLGCLGGEPCRFIATQPFPYDGRHMFTGFYKKNGFRVGRGEMYLETNGRYEPRTTPEYRPAPGDRDRTIVLFNSACPWGGFMAFTTKEIVEKMDPDHPVEVYDIWEKPEEYSKRSVPALVSGLTIVKGRRISRGIFWSDREAYCREVGEALRA